MIRDLEEIGRIWKCKGTDYVVRIVDAGHGPKVDVREFSTEESEPKRRKVGNTWQDLEPYVGPTAKGLHLAIGPAEELSEMIARGTVRASELEATMETEE